MALEGIDNPNIHVVLDCVIPFITDRNTLSLICQKSYDIEGKTRRHVTVETHYATSPSRVCQRFPFLQSLTLHGTPELDDHDVFITPWVQQITSSLYLLNSVCFERLFISDSDLELLAQTRGKQLRVIEVSWCAGFSTSGLFHIGRYCNNLRDLCLFRNKIDENGENWLRELGSRNTVIEKLKFQAVNFDIKDFVIVAKNCRLVSVKIDSRDFIDFVEFFRYAVYLEEFGCGEFSYDHKDDYNYTLKFPNSLKHLMMRISYRYPDVKNVSFAHFITELNCKDGYPHGRHGRHVGELIKSCCNLKVLYTTGFMGDDGLRDVSICCKKLRKLYVNQWGYHKPNVSHNGVSFLAKQCVELECLHIGFVSMTNKVLCKIGKHMKKLKEFKMGLVYKHNFPPDDEVRSLLIGCDKLEKLDLHFVCELGLFVCGLGLSDKGLEYIGKYGCNLRHLTFRGNVGESDAGLVELSKGCPKLKYLATVGCRFSKEAFDIFRCNVTSLRHLRVDGILSSAYRSMEPKEG
ncbi:coronatine-insensitive protein 1-like [Rutidosis leptorrhynchoides]|uniref:coronatine-insensitive protein 1-like n=1 Tax=Rutidosis leptorrhynchoides TaxID=125765 RepID=UPI003A997371